MHHPSTSRFPGAPWVAWPFLALLCLSVSRALASDIDLRNGRDINEVCAGCHGEFGEGGKEGEYPRIAGQPHAFLVRQLELFRERHRPNMAMIEYVDDRQMPDVDIADVSAYLAGIDLPTRLPPLDETQSFDALARLEQAKQVMNIPPAEGDPVAGEQIYNKECRSCHGVDGWGEKEKGVPMIAGQYTNYLWRQVEKYRSKIRIHDPDDPEDDLLGEFSDAEIQNVLAFLSIVDDR